MDSAANWLVEPAAFIGIDSRENALVFRRRVVGILGGRAGEGVGG